MTRFDPQHLPAEVLEFLTDPHLASLTTLRRNGSPHVVPVGFTFDPVTATVRVITSGESVKARNADRETGLAAVCQADRARWLTLEGPIWVERDADAVRDAERRYAERYRTPRENPKRVVLVIDVAAVLGSVRPPSAPADQQGPGRSK